MQVSSFFLVSNYKIIHKKDKICCRKLQKLIPNIHETSIIYNVYSVLDYHLTNSDKSLLIKGFNFAIQPKKIEYSKFLLLFKLLFRGIKSKNEYSVYLVGIKVRLQDSPYILLGFWKRYLPSI